MDSAFALLLHVQTSGDLGPEVLERLEAFLIEELGKAGVWRGRESDGVSWARCVAADETVVRVCGEVWEVGDQELHGFWLDVQRSVGATTSWTLHYNLDHVQMAPGATRDALHLIEDPADVPWKVTLSSE